MNCHAKQRTEWNVLCLRYLYKYIIIRFQSEGMIKAG